MDKRLNWWVIRTGGGREKMEFYGENGEERVLILVLIRHS